MQNSNGRPEYRILEWDSEFFGFGVARVLTKEFASALELNLLVRELTQKHIRLAYCMTLPGDEISARHLRDSGAIALGTRVVYRADLAMPSPPPRQKFRVIDVEEFTAGD